METYNLLALSGAMPGSTLTVDTAVRHMVGGEDFYVSLLPAGTRIERAHHGENTGHWMDLPGLCRAILPEGVLPSDVKRAYGGDPDTARFAPGGDWERSQWEETPAGKARRDAEHRYEAAERAYFKASVAHRYGDKGGTAEALASARAALADARRQLDATPGFGD